MINWMALATSAGGPALAFVLKFLLSDRETGSLRNLRKHATLAKKLPKGAAKHFDDMLQVEAEAYSRARVRRVTRKLNGSALAALIFVGLVTAGATAFFVRLATVHWVGWWFFAAAVALFGMLLMIVGTGQVYVYPDGDEKAKALP